MNNTSLSVMLLLVIPPALSAQSPQPASAVSLHLRDIKAVYVGSFGTSAGTDLIREKVLSNLVKSGRLDVVESPAAADAILTGAGETSVQFRFSGTEGGTKSHANAAVRLVGRAEHKIL